MCLWKIRIRGVKIAGRQLYRTDAGVRLGYHGPLVSLESLLSELSLPLAQSVTDNVSAIDRKINAGEIDVTRFADRSPAVPNSPDENPWYRDENPGVRVTGTAVAASVANYYGNMAADTATFLHEQEDELTRMENDPVTGYTPREVDDCPF